MLRRNLNIVQRRPYFFSFLSLVGRGALLFAWGCLGLLFSQPTKGELCRHGELFYMLLLLALTSTRPYIRNLCSSGNRYERVTPGGRGERVCSSIWQTKGTERESLLIGNVVS